MKTSNKVTINNIENKRSILDRSFSLIKGLPFLVSMPYEIKNWEGLGGIIMIQVVVGTLVTAFLVKKFASNENQKIILGIYVSLVFIGLIISFLKKRAKDTFYYSNDERTKLRSV